MYFPRQHYNIPVGQKYFTDNKCPVSQCSVTYDKTLADQADAIVFKDKVNPRFMEGSVRNSIAGFIQKQNTSFS